MYGNVAQTEVQSKRGVAYLSMVEAVLILGGVLLVLGFFMDWVSYKFVADTVTIKGYEFGRLVGNYPETLLLPFCGLLFIAGGFFGAGRRRAYMPQKVSRGVFLAGAWIAAIVAMFLSVWLTIRFSDFLMDTRGITIYNNLELGWFITVSGNIVLYIGCILAVSKKARKLGFSDYYFIRSDSAETQSDVKHEAPKAMPPAPAPHPMPPAHGAPQLPPPQGQPPRPPQGAPPPRPPLPPPQGQPPRPPAQAGPAPPQKKEEDWK